MPGHLSRRDVLRGGALLGLSTPVATPGPAAGWTPLAEMPIARSETPAALLDGYVYVVGGFGADAAAHRYDVAADAWEQIADYPMAVNHPGIAVHRGRLLVGGGYSADGGSAYSEVYAYDVEADTWELIGELPLPMGAFGFAVIDDDLYVVGGAADRLGGPPLDLVARWSADDGAWHPRAPLPHAREHLAVVAAAGSIVAVGGRAHSLDSDELGAEVTRYDPARDEWEALPPLPTPRSGLAGAAVCAGVVVGGGETATAVFANVDYLDLGRREWRARPALPVARHGIAVAALDGRLHAIGGSTLAERVANVTLNASISLACT